MPHESISIITPYKGQRGVIIKALQANGVLKRRDPRSKTGPAAMDDRIAVSTVDRYQGDENDIVILSLVQTNPGNQFVSLQNRFVVATSRARIGFFIIVDLIAQFTQKLLGLERQ